MPGRDHGALLGSVQVIVPRCTSALHWDKGVGGIGQIDTASRACKEEKPPGSNNEKRCI